MIDVDIKKVDYTVDYEYGPSCTMHILGRTKGGTRVHLRDSDFEPYFYVPYDEFDSDLETNDKVVRHQRGYENIRGDEVVKVHTRIPGDVPKLRDNYDHHEADILFPNRYLIDNNIEDAIKIPKKHATPEPTDISLNEITPVSGDAKSRVCFCDIEVYNKEGFPDEENAEMPITSIAVYDNYIDEYRVYMYHPDLPQIHHDKAEVYVYEEEHQMLIDFCDYLTNRQFDTIAGWNFSDFDARYIVNRLDTLSDDYEDIHMNNLSPLDSAYDDGSWFGGKIKGISVFDMLMAYKNLQFTELDSFSLENVAQDILGEGKVEYDKELWELWEDDPQTLVDYNVIDVELTVKLEQQEEIIKFYEAMATFVGGRVAEVIDPSNAVDIQVLRQVNGEYAVPSAKNNDGGDFEGGAVFDPITGVRDNVIVLDLKSLYPMSMKTINAGPRTKDPNGEITAPNGISFSDENKSIVVDIIDNLLDEREDLKEKRDSFGEGTVQYKTYDRQQRAVKVTMNTLYGVLGWSKFRLYDKDVGAAVTATGRECIEYTEKVVNDLGYDVIYGDTDSVMIELGPDATKEDALEIGHKLEEEINDKYDKFAKEELNVDEHWFQIEFEKLYRKYFQSGNKKRYAGHITWKEGKDVDDTDIVGYETNRSDYSAKAKALIKKVFNIILGGGTLSDVSEVVNSTIDELQSGEVDPDEYGIPSSVNKNFDEYDTPTKEVRGAMYSNEAFGARIQPGDKPKGMYVKRVEPNEDGVVEYDQPPMLGYGSMYICWMSFNDVPDCFAWDWETYIDKQLKSPIERILTGTDWTWQEVRSGNRQPRLGEYNFEEKEGETYNIEGADDEVEEDPHIEPTKSKDSLAQELSEAQNALDEFDKGDDDGETLQASMKERDREHADLDAFMGSD